MSARETVAMLAAGGFNAPPDGDACWGKCLVIIGQARHERMTKEVGVGAPNAVVTSVEWARELASQEREQLRDASEPDSWADWRAAARAELGKLR